ncbi:MAG: DUF4838 domain-containing protein [Sedimentisphaeraceae bacterium JB056]
MDWKKTVSLDDQLSIVEDGVSEYSIYAENEPTLRFAAEQLQSYIQQISGAHLPIVDEFNEDGCFIVLAKSDSELIKPCLQIQELEYDGFCIWNESKNIYITSNYPRGVLFAVYEFLEQQGCVFVQAAGIGEFVPELRNIFFCDTIFQNPSLELRGITQAPLEFTQEWVDEYYRIIDNAAKNKINSVFIHCKLELELTGITSVISDEIKKRGLVLEIGGHGAEKFINKDLFEQKPYLFREKDGRRTQTGNICSSSVEAMDIISQNLGDYFKRNENIDILHCWFEDVEGGSWCSCQQCKEVTPINQQFNVLSKISSNIKKVYPDKHLDMLLYHDTIIGISDLDVDNEQGIYGFFAPRERCYAHSLDDQNCPLNRRYFHALKDTVSIFGEDYSYIFEYYGDLILYVKNKTIFSRTIAGDIRAYANNGIRKMTTLCFGAYSVWAYPVNIFTYAKHCWNSDLDVNGTVKLFAKGLRLDGDDYIEYLELVQRADSKTYAFCGYEMQFGDIRVLPVEPLKYYGEHVSKIKEALQLLSQAEGVLERIAEGIAPEISDYLKYESIMLKITKLETESIYYRMHARYLNKIDAGSVSKHELAKCCKKVIDLQNEMKSIIQDVPLEIKGTVGSKTFPVHLCSEQIDIMRDVIENELGLDFVRDIEQKY